VEAFVANLSTQEKIARLIDLQAENSRLGVPTYSWNTEALHGLGASCVKASDGSARCPTIFPAPPGLGATWNRSLWRAEGEVIGDEARAYNNHGQHRNWNSRPIGINLWVPSLDLNRDPRGGRNEEVCDYMIALSFFACRGAYDLMLSGCRYLGTN
jgi:beta-glucosidase-like glycosyl hydrolase